MRYTLSQKSFADSFPAIKPRFFALVCWINLFSDKSRLEFGLKIIGSDIINSVNSGYHGWFGQLGTTTILHALSLLILTKVFRIRMNGGKA